MKKSQTPPNVVALPTVPSILVRPCFSEFRLVSLEKRTELNGVNLVPGFTLLSKTQLSELTSLGYKVNIDEGPTEVHTDKTY